MKVLQISNDFGGSKVHSNLIKRLDELGLEQIVYCPVRDKNLIGNNQFDGGHISFVYSHIIKSWYKFVYYYKRRILYKDLKKKVNLSSVDLIHAATLYADGGLAYKAYKEYGIPYVVAVRATDIYKFGHLQPHTWPTGRKILKNASKVYFISKAPKQEFESLRLVSPILDEVKDKFILRPNGVEDFWHNHVHNESHNGHKILYIGNFHPYKNVIRILKAVNLLREEEGFNDVQLTIIGGGKDKNDKVKKLVLEQKEFVHYLGPIYDKEKLAEIMNQHSIFVMPSIHETFGLVYIESLSQNLPVIFSKGQGIDGLFDEMNNPVGLSVNCFSVEDIKNAIKTILINPNKYSNKQVDFNLFDWNRIAEKYFNDYKEILSGKK